MSPLVVLISSGWGPKGVDMTMEVEVGVDMALALE